MTTEGPYGDQGGKSWDDGCHDVVREITLAYDQVIHSISVVYDDDGRPVEAEKHGGLGGTKTDKKMTITKRIRRWLKGSLEPKDTK
ncbi:hypothetical protein Nepgr_016081 [Nepenthes gracilis]|uniref:Jacalin-type lectin domain-containing protein n=1 Tax=Nepenthes gracilis TaxID=150966 RepID=A0AAD3SM12_NEPGR|nr:hypothetical protein Nepgr_016081 [Nepenthes gracilis]